MKPISDGQEDRAGSASRTFDKLADKYREKFMDLSLYDASYAAFCDQLKSGAAKVLDAACGPGNVARFLLSRRPELDLLGIDLAPRMVELAQSAVPKGRFRVHDCRRISDLAQRFDGILCAFGLPYLTADEADRFMADAAQVLNPGGLLYLSTMLGAPDKSGLHRCASGDQVYIHYHQQERLIRSLSAHGFRLTLEEQLASPATASLISTDLILIAQGIA